MALQPSPCTRVCLTLAFAVAALISTDSGECARWYEDYALAVEHIEAGTCSTEAIEALGAAVVDKSKPKRDVKTYAQRRIDYLPYYQLARAHLLCGNTDLARQYLERSRSFQVASDDELVTIEGEILVLASATEAEPTVPSVDLEALENRKQAAEQNLTGARGALSSTNDSLARAGDLAVENPHWADQRDNSARRIESLAEAIGKNHGELDLLGLADAAHSATEITRSLDALTIQINRAVEDRRAAVQPIPTSPTMVTEVRPTPSPLPENVSAKPATTVPTPSPLISARLSNAADAFVTGNYASVMTILDSFSLEDPNAQAAALLIRAAACLSLAAIEEDRPTARSLTETAEADIVACRRLNPEIRLDPALFPPLVVDFFEGKGPRNPKPTENDLS